MARGDMDDYLSDDEIFIGQFTLKEAKKRVIPDNFNQTVGNDVCQERSCNSSLKLIETHSMPDIIPKNVTSASSTKSVSSPTLTPMLTLDCDLRPNDSFLEIEKMVSELAMSPAKVKTNQLEYSTPMIKKILSNRKLQELKNDLNSNIKVNTPIQHEEQNQLLQEQEPNYEFRTPIKTSKYDVLEGELFSTPSGEIKPKTPVFKTPGNPVSQKKHLLTPKKYQHVVSPVAAYIKNSPMVPLVKDVCPRKALPGISSIPKLVKTSSHQKVNNKENVAEGHKQGNVILPSVAYKSAKETKVIDIPDEGKLPQSQWARQVASSIPRALVLKHNHREITSARKCLQKNEDSFADLSLQQADLSVCTQKSAITKHKRNM